MLCKMHRFSVDAECSKQDEDLPCKIIIRSRLAQTPWEKLCRAVVGEPVHMDVVLAKPQSSSQRFCFSSYMNQVCTASWQEHPWFQP